MSKKIYTKDHEWIQLEGETATVGITNHAQESLGDVVFIDLPTIGLKTIIQSKASGLKGIVLKGNKNIFLEKKKSIIFANKNKMFIKAI